MKDYIKDTILSLKRGFPFIAIETSDYQQTLADLKAGLGEETNGGQRALLHHDMARGALGVNPLGVDAQAKINDGGEPAVTTAKIEECLQRALDLMPSGSILVIDDMHLLMEHKDDTIRALYVQCIRNCRDAFKSSKRTLVFLCPKFKPPIELGKDMDIIVAPTPTHEDRIALAKNVCKGAQLPEAEPEKLEEVASITRGLTAFAAENLMAMAIGKEGFSLPVLRRGSVAAINAMSGLTVHQEKTSFDQIGGLEYLKKLGRKIIAGRMKPRLIVLLDEVEKQLSGLGDSNGINQDCFGQILQGMNDNNWQGILLPGYPGVGKTEWGKAMGAEADGVFVSLDLGALKGGLVGSSERMVRAALGVIKDIGGDRVLFVSTCNSMKALRPEFISRQEDVVFVGRPDKEVREAIFKIHMQAFGIPDQELPPSDKWAGREIRNCVRKAWKYNSTLIEEAQSITPGVGGDELCEEAAASGWISAETGKPYTTKRSLDLAKTKKMIDEPRDINLN